MEENEFKCPCPLCNRDITVDDCFMISFVAEETAPDNILPDFIKLEDIKRQKEICLKCKYHPE